MRKFALLPLFFGLSLSQLSFGQVRDLFAEFEQESTAAPAAAPASSAAVVPASSAAVPPPSSAIVAPASSSAKAVASSTSKKAKAKSSSSIAVSSSSNVPASVEQGRTKPVEVSSSSIVDLSSSSVVVSSADVSSSSIAVVESSSSVADAMSSVAVVDTALLDSASRDSVIRAEAIAEAERIRAKADSSRRADSIVQAVAAGISNMSSSSVAVASSNSMSRRDLLGPVKVSKVHGIDEMKGRYKNPRKALFLSLLVPGAGQLYVGGTTATYVRGGVYLALEVMMWSGWGYFSIHKYNEQVKKYKKFAKEHYSIGRYEYEMRSLYNTEADLYGGAFNSRYMGTRKSFCEAIYGNAGKSDGGCYHENVLFEDDAKHLNVFREKDKNLGEEMKSFKRDFSKESEVFQLISENAYVLGWDDVDSPTLASDLGLEDPNSEIVSLGESEHLRKYRSMRRDANDYADMQAWFIGGLILNHIISAVDAALTANAHNKVLYEEDVAWYSRLHFDSGISFNDSFGWTVRANWGF